MPQPVIELGGAADAPVMHIAVANGFVPQTYLPLARHFRDDYRVISLPPRALWGEGLPPEITSDTDWRHLRDDLLNAFEQYDLRDVIAVGHSFGGIASLLAVLEAPQRFKALILLDPTILTPDICRLMQKAREGGRIGEHPLVQMAQRRRREFDSVEDAFERFRDKSLFAQWSDEALRLYVEHGTVEHDGQRVLKWPPEWEAFYFSTAYTAIWDTLPALANVTVPMLFVAGGESDTFIPASAQRVREMLPAATHATIDGHGHLFPQSAPDVTARIMRDWLAQLR